MEFRRIAAHIYKANLRWRKAVALAKQDRLYKARRRPGAGVLEVSLVVKYWRETISCITLSQVGGLGGPKAGWRCFGAEHAPVLGTLVHAGARVAAACHASVTVHAPAASGQQRSRCRRHPCARACMPLAARSRERPGRSSRKH